MCSSILSNNPPPPDEETIAWAVATVLGAAFDTVSHGVFVVSYLLSFQPHLEKKKEHIYTSLVFSFDVSSPKDSTKGSRRDR